MRYNSNCTKNGQDCLKCYIRHKCGNYNPDNSTCPFVVGDTVKVLNNKYRTHFTSYAPMPDNIGKVTEISKDKNQRYNKWTIYVAMNYGSKTLFHHKALEKLTPVAASV